MATISTLSANSTLDMSDPLLVRYFGTPNPQETFFGYVARSGVDNFVQYFGSGFTYAGAGDHVEFTGGNITGFELDRNVDEVIATPELSISGLAGVDAAAIDKHEPRTIWDQLLKGDDTCNLTGLDKELVGLGTNVVFGDDLVHDATLGTAVFRGGRDSFQVGDNRFELAGDVLTMSGEEGRAARYAGGADRIVSGGVPAGATGQPLTLWGDARTVAAWAVLTGGADRITITNYSGRAVVAGDAGQLLDGGRLNGGDDRIALTLAGAGDFPQVAGDVHELQAGGMLQGGDDWIRVGGGAFVEAGGDVWRIGPDAPGFHLIGGGDTLIGLGGDDVLAGDLARMDFKSALITGGDDLIRGGGGDDVLLGEAGQDGTAFGTLMVNSIGGDDTLDGGRGDDILVGQSGDDLLLGGEGRDSLAGAGGDDRVEGGGGSDQITGDAGADTIAGGDDRDRLDGGEGADSLDGGADADRLIGGAGVDRLTGGSGRDWFTYLVASESGPSQAERDRVLDFVVGTDLIDLSGMDAIGGTGGGGNDAFTFIGQAGFSQAGQIRVSQVGTDTLVQANTVGSGVAELSILLIGVNAATLTAADFVL